MLISVIISTYNWPDALHCVLKALNYQKDRDFEIIIADDGSDEKTKNTIENFKKISSIPLTHIWHEDLGFRAASIRNKAVVQAKGDYLIFLDGDCVALPTFICNHRRLAERNFFVSGNRVLLSESATPQFIKGDELFFQQTLWQWIVHWWRGDCNRWSPLLKLKLGIFRKLRQTQWRGAKTCNLGIYRQDFMAINGMDEGYVGWGYEDSDLVVRLQNNGTMRKDGRYFIPVLHLWHQHNKNPTTLADNFSRFQAVIKSKESRAKLGIDQYTQIK